MPNSVKNMADLLLPSKSEPYYILSNCFYFYLLIWWNMFLFWFKTLFYVFFLFSLKNFPNNVFWSCFLLSQLPSDSPRNTIFKIMWIDELLKPIIERTGLCHLRNGKKVQVLSCPLLPNPRKFPAQHDEVSRKPRSDFVLTRWRNQGF